MAPGALIPIPKRVFDVGNTVSLPFWVPLGSYWQPVTAACRGVECSGTADLKTAIARARGPYAKYSVLPLGQWKHGILGIWPQGSSYGRFQVGYA